MKALILAGGKGTRLRPITFTRAKQLVPVANKPILFYAIEAIRDAGITDIGVIVGDTADEVTRGARRRLARGACSITYIPQEAPLGLAHAVKIAEEFIGRRAVRDVPGRQPASRTASAASSTSSGRAAATRRSCSRTCPTPTSSASPSSARRPGRAPRREAREPAERPGARRRLPVRRGDLRGGQRDRAVAARRARDHRRHPVARRQRPHACGRTSSTAGGRTPASSTTCSRPTASCSTRSARAAAPSRATARCCMAACAWARARPSCNSACAARSIIGEGCEIRDAYIGPYTSVGDGCKVHRQRGRALDPACATRASRASARAWPTRCWA